MPDVTKPPVADTVQQHQLLGPAKRTVLFALFDYFFSKMFADVGYPLQLVFVSCIDIYGFLCGNISYDPLRLWRAFGTCTAKKNTTNQKNCRKPAGLSPLVSARLHPAH